jgi:hypothetical protein
LKFYEANTALVNEEFSESVFEEKVAKIVVGTIEVEDDEEEMMEMASKEHIAQIEEELFENNNISHEAFPGNGDDEIITASKEHIAQITEELFEKNNISHEAFPAKDISTNSSAVKEEVVVEETKEEVIETKSEKKEITSNPEIIGTKVSKQISMDDILVHDYQATMFVKKDEPIIEELIKEPVFEAVQPEEISGEIKEELDKSDEVEVVIKEELVVKTPKEEIKEEVIEVPKAEAVPTGKAIVLGLNDKIAFEKNLFAGNGDDLQRVLSQLNTFTNWDEAKSFVLDFVKPDYNNWENKEEFEVRFLEIVENKFK